MLFVGRKKFIVVLWFQMKSVRIHQDPYEHQNISFLVAVVRNTDCVFKRQLSIE